MTIKILSNIALICCLMVNFPIQAAKTVAQCEKIKNNVIKTSRCFDTVKAATERELKIWVNNYTLNLGHSPENLPNLRMFKRSQNNFITFRENDCRWQYLSSKEHVRADIIYKKCYISLSQQRIKELSLIELRMNKSKKK